MVVRSLCQWEASSLRLGWKSFSPTSKRGALAVELLCGGFRIILAWVTGGEEWISEIFMFENNYNVDELCRRCKATKRGGLLSAFNF